MSGKRSKKIRKLAAAMEPQGKGAIYVHKKTRKVFTDHMNNVTPYLVTQVRMIPQCQKRIAQTIKGRPEAWSLETLKDLGYSA